MFTVTKTYRDLPAAHRQPTHDGHCRLIHGHNWQFDIEFGCNQLDKNGFVIDVGELGFVKEFLNEKFDHTLLLNQDDPLLLLLIQTIGHLGEDGAAKIATAPDGYCAKIVTVPNCGMEGLAEYVFHEVQVKLDAREQYHKRGVHVIRVTCLEDSKNAATYYPEEE